LGEIDSAEKFKRLIDKWIENRLRYLDQACHGIRAICSNFNSVDELNVTLSELQAETKQIIGVEARQVHNELISTITQMIDAHSRVSPPPAPASIFPYKCWFCFSMCFQLGKLWVFSGLLPHASVGSASRCASNGNYGSSQGSSHASVGSAYDVLPMEIMGLLGLFTCKCLILLLEVLPMEIMGLLRALHMQVLVLLLEVLPMEIASSTYLNKRY